MLVEQEVINFIECILCTEEEADNGRDRDNEIEQDGEVTEKGSWNKHASLQKLNVSYIFIYP